jgi:hypothetical protein
MRDLARSDQSAQVQVPGDHMLRTSGAGVVSIQLGKSQVQTPVHIVSSLPGNIDLILGQEFMLQHCACLQYLKQGIQLTLQSPGSCSHTLHRKLPAKDSSAVSKSELRKYSKMNRLFNVVLNMSGSASIEDLLGDPDNPKSNKADFKSHSPQIQSILDKYSDVLNPDGC